MGTVSKLFSAVKSPFFALARAYNATAEKRPLSTGLITTVAKTSAADYFAQKVGAADRTWLLPQRQLAWLHQPVPAR